jgi:CubicO group peptidase (beta-lactamase class C family)
MTNHKLKRMNKNILAMRTALIVSALIFSCFSLPAQDKANYSKEVEARIKKVEQSLGGQIKIEGSPDWTIEERLAVHNIPGLTIAVISNYKVEWAKGYGWADKEEKRSVTTETLFQAASISKSLNAVGVLKLVQDKKLDLQTDVNTYLTSWKFPYDSLSKGKKITLYNILTHTAGLSVHGFPGYDVKEPLPTVTQILDGVKPANNQPVRSMFEPGLRSQYSGGGTTLSQLVVMEVTHKPYDVYQWENVLRPLGMTSSFYTVPPPAGKLQQLASGYRVDGKPIEGKYHHYPEQGAAALWTNPTDLSKYIIETQLSLEGKSSKVLSQEMTKIRLTPFPETGAALGVFIDNKGGEKYFTHGGANEGFRCHYFGSETGGNGVVVMVNSDNGEIIMELINSVARVYQWKNFYNPTLKKVVDVPEDVLSSYEGEFQIAPQFALKITKEGKSLKVEPTGQGKYDLYAEESNKFFLTIVDAQIEFVKGTDGNIEKLILHQNGRHMDGKKVR